MKKKAEKVERRNLQLAAREGGSVELREQDMITKLSPQLIDPNTIPCHYPGPYCMSFGFHVRHLIRSIKEVGLINTPLLTADGQGNWIVVAGYRRMQAVASLGWNRVPCRVIASAQVSPLDCLLINLHDNLATRKFNEVEKAMVLSRLASYLPRSEILAHYMPMLDLPSHEPTFLLFRDIEEVLDKDIKGHLALGLLSLQAAKMLLDLDDNARSSLNYLIGKLKLNVNQQKQMIDYIVDLSHNSHKSVSAFLEDHPLKSICADSRMNNPQKARAVLQLLRRERYPELISSEKAFKEKVSRLGLPTGVKITHPPFFEAADHRLEVLFKDGKELRYKLGQISGVEGIEELGDPWKEST